tara:strand:+ start:158 stop:397 length:240 start_codon:yes stop_codon:yes gene_type:complete
VLSNPLSPEAEAQSSAVQSSEARQNERAALGRVGVDDGADAFTACYANSCSGVDGKNARAPANLPNLAIENRQRKNSTP